MVVTNSIPLRGRGATIATGSSRCRSRRCWREAIQSIHEDGSVSTLVCLGFDWQGAESPRR